MREAARLEHASELRKGSHWIVNVDNGVAGADAVERSVRQRQALGRKQMGGDTVGETRCLCPRLSALDELSVDVECVDVARGPDPAREFDCRVPRTTAEIGNSLSLADLGSV
jgi:hypothetical protein